MQILKKTYNKSQLSMLSKSMIIGGGFFILTGILSIILCELITDFLPNLKTNYVFLNIVIGSIIVTYIMSLVWKSIGWNNKNKIWTITITIIYSALLSIALGYLFALIKQEFTNGYYLIYLSFVITGAIAFIAGLISINLNKKGAITFGKFLAMLIFIMMGVSLITLFLLWISLFYTNLLVTVNSLIFILIIGSAFLSFCYLIADILLIMKFQQLKSLTADENINNNLVWYFGFRLLTDLINIFLYVIYFLLKHSRKS